MMRCVFFLIVFFTCFGYAQETLPVKCYTNEYIWQEIQSNPELSQKIIEEEQKLSAWINKPKFLMDDSIITIPVVFHVIYNTAAENIPNAVILEQLQVFNEDFSGSNSDTTNVPNVFKHLIGNSKIQFCLAQRDPSGNATTGIVRVSTTTTSFPSNNAMKYTSTGGDDIWDRNKYLNVWICKLTGNVIGYSSLPGSASATDGVVIDYRYIGLTGSLAPYNLGHSVSHEVAHWFNLLHLWGAASCGDDFVSDTPVQQKGNFGSSGNCPTFPLVTCGNGPNGDMWMNFMDYTYDHCMYFFSAGQAARMRAAIHASRSSLKTSNGCLPVGLVDEIDFADVRIYPNPASELINVNFTAFTTKEITVSLVNILGEYMVKKVVSSNSINQVAFPLNDLNAGIYFIEISSNNFKTTQKVVIQN